MLQNTGLFGRPSCLPQPCPRPHAICCAGWLSHLIFMLPSLPIETAVPAASQNDVFAKAPSFSKTEFRASLAMFATGVTIVTARTPSGVLVGLTANSFNSVSMSPPLVLWSLSHAASSMAALSTGSHYAINILAADQQALAERFASKHGDRWDGVAFADGMAGAPLLTGAVASFECFNRSQYTEGDHVIFVGEVERCSHRPGAAPLLYHGGKFYTEHPL